MGTTCLTVCSECGRHLRCEERACPFCGARIQGGLRVLEYRIKSRLSRGQAFSLGASLTIAGFVTSCEQRGGPVYGAPCNPPSCSPPISGGNAGAAAHGGTSSVGGTPNAGGAAGSGGSTSGGNAGTAGAVTAGTGGAAGSGGVSGSGGSAGSAGSAGEAAGGAGGEDPGGAGGQAGAGGP